MRRRHGKRTSVDTTTLLPTGPARTRHLVCPHCGYAFSAELADAYICLSCADAHPLEGEHCLCPVCLNESPVGELLQ